jgi:hypothetical protein
MQVVDLVNDNTYVHTYTVDLCHCRVFDQVMVGTIRPTVSPPARHTHLINATTLASYHFEAKKVRKKVSLKGIGKSQLHC